MPRPKKGEKTPGSGIKKGQKHQATIDKEFYRERLRQLVCAELDPMTLAQVEHAKGVNYMVLRNPDGTYARATDVKQIDAACAIGATAFQINTQSPNTQAFTALLDRALDRPKEQPLDVNLTGTLDLVPRLQAARLRLKK